MSGIDFNLPLNFGQCTFIDFLKGLADACRTHSFLTTIRLFTQETIRKMRSTISRQPSRENLFMFRPIPLHGICSDNLPSEPSRHRNLSSDDAAETLPLRHTREYISNHAGKGKRKSRMENLCRLRTNPDNQSPDALRRRRLRHATEPRCLCSGFNHHRFMSVIVSMGKISYTQSCGQDTHSYGLKRLYTNVYPHYRWKSPRCQFPRRSGFRARGDLCYGPRIPRLRSSFFLYSKSFNFYHESQKQFQLSAALLSQYRQNYRVAMRPNNQTQWILCIAGLPRCSSPNRLLRYRNTQEVHLSNEQLFTGRFDNRPTLQMPLADRNLFQMDQAVPANQNAFRHQYQCSENSNLDCYQRLCSGGNCQERTQNQTEFGRNPANSQHCTFRESSYYTSTYENYVAKHKHSVS